MYSWLYVIVLLLPDNLSSVRLNVSVKIKFLIPSKCDSNISKIQHTNAHSISIHTCMHIQTDRHTHTHTHTYTHIHRHTHTYTHIHTHTDTDTDTHTQRLKSYIWSASLKSHKSHISIFKHFLL